MTKALILFCLTGLIALGCDDLFGDSNSHNVPVDIAGGETTSNTDTVGGTDTAGSTDTIVDFDTVTDPDTSVGEDLTPSLPLELFYPCVALSDDGFGQEVSLFAFDLENGTNREVVDYTATFPQVDPAEVRGVVPYPDGSGLLVLVLGNDGFKAALLKTNIATGASEILVDDIVVGSYDYQASRLYDISSTGQVAYLGPNVNSQRKQISLVNLDGTGGQSLLDPTWATNNWGGVWWKNDDKTLVALHTTGDNAGIYAVDSMTGTYTLLELLNQQTLLGSPEKFAYHRATGKAAVEYYKNFNTATPNQEILAWTTIPGEEIFNTALADAQDSSPTFTPDGKMMFSRYDTVQSQGSTLMVTLAQGAAPITLENEMVNYGPDSFSADGATLYFAMNDGSGKVSIYQRPLPGGQASIVVDGATLSCRPGFPTLLR